MTRGKAVRLFYSTVSTQVSTQTSFFEGKINIMSTDKKTGKPTQIKIPGVVIVIFNTKDNRSLLTGTQVILPKAVAS